MCQCRLSWITALFLCVCVRKTNCWQLWKIKVFYSEIFKRFLSFFFLMYDFTTIISWRNNWFEEAQRQPFVWPESDCIYLLFFRWEWWTTRGFGLIWNCHRKQCGTELPWGHFCRDAPEPRVPEAPLTLWCLNLTMILGQTWSGVQSVGDGCEPVWPDRATSKPKWKFLLNAADFECVGDLALLSLLSLLLQPCCRVF